MLLCVEATEVPLLAALLHPPPCPSGIELLLQISTSTTSQTQKTPGTLAECGWGAAFRRALASPSLRVWNCDCTMSLLSIAKCLSMLICEACFVVHGLAF